MKIFNWVHNKFHRNADNYLACPKKDVPAFDAKKPEAAIKDADREALLDHVTFEDMLDDWKDGILTIGTFGFDTHPLKPPGEHDECQPTDTKEETYEGGEEFSFRPSEEQVDHYVVKAFKQEFQKVLDSTSPAAAAGSSSKPDQLVSVIDDVPLLRFLESPQIITEVDENDKKKRTTLAELFSADSTNATAAGKPEPDEKIPYLVMEQVCSKDTDAFAKKVMPSKGDNSANPMKKINRMVTKMLKTKIHPDEFAAGSRTHGNEGHEQLKQKVKGAKKQKDQQRMKWICLA